jgi:hypothetical protein
MFDKFQLNKFLLVFGILIYKNSNVCMVKKRQGKDISEKHKLKQPDRKFDLKPEYIFLALIMIFTLLVRLRLLSFPLERDEGEYAYMGSLLLDGIAPYKEAYNMKFPGTYIMYALNLLVFGKTIEGVHLGLLWANLLTIVFVYLLAKKFMNGLYGVLAAAVFALSSLGAGVYGFAAHATHFVILAAVAGLFLTYRAFEKNNLISYLMAGFVLGCSPIMKQSGIFFTLAGGILLLTLWIEKYGLSEVKQFLVNMIVYIAGGILPFAMVAVYLLSQGVWDKFVFWTITYASDYSNQVPAGKAFDIFKMMFAHISKSYLLFWILSFIGLFTGFFVKEFRMKAIFILAFGVLSFASICPGFYFREHYFVQYLPVLGLSFSVFLYSLEFYLIKINKTPFVKTVKWLVFALLVIPTLKAESNYLFKGRVNSLSKSIYKMNPFVESIQLSKFIKENTSEGDRIAVMGSEPQLFFYSDRKSATGYIYTYGLMEKHANSLAMQKEMAAEIEKNKPEMIVLINVFTSWLMRPDSEKYILEWYGKYIKEKGYTIVGIIGMDDRTLVTGKELETYQLQAEQYIMILQKLHRHSDLKTTTGYQANFITRPADKAPDAVINF